MRILVVGAGAVGRVYGAALARGGAEVVVFVRDKHAAEAKRGFPLTRIAVLGRRETQHFTPDDVVVGIDEVANDRFEQVWLAVPTDALEGVWLDQLLRATRQATIVCLQPGLDVHARLVALVPEDRLVFGGIGMLAYATPMEGSTDPRETSTGPGVAYFFPPGNPTRVSGTSERRAIGVRDALRAGDCPVELVRDARVELVFGSAALLPQMAALEIAGWTFEGYRKSNAPELGAAASREAVDVASAVLGLDPPPATSLLLAPLLRVGTRVANLTAPLDIESFLRVHFKKVGAQTRLLLRQWREAAIRHELPHEGIDALLEELDAVEAAAAPEG
jgi:2-dehydropantoate 2-reductase